MEFEANESVVIVGPSGCGKTTLLKLLLGLLEPTEGEILIDDIPIQRIGYGAYRSLIGAVLQDDALLAGSIGENISFFANEVGQDRLEDCAKAAAIHDEIHRMPMGYETLIGDMGSTLSGGQKQRILLARALFREPKLLLLDEATSHLDMLNELRIMTSLSNMILTRIVVAHRQETISAAQRVLRLNSSDVILESSAGKLARYALSNPD